MRPFHRPPKTGLSLADRLAQSESPPPEDAPSNKRDSSTNNDEQGNGEEEEEEDDYMTMTFGESTPSQPETSLQRRQRLQKEGLKRGRVPSKAELAAQERERREQGLSRSLISPAGAAPTAKSKGLAMMAKMGFKPGSTLGAAGGEARAEPLKIEVREDRGGIGLEGERKRKLVDALGAEAVEAAEKRAKGELVVDEGGYRERMAREREVERKEKLVRAAAKIAERMDEDRAEVADGGDKKDGARGGASSRPLKAVSVLYRGLVRHRELVERDRRMRHDLEVSAGTLSAKLPTYEEDEGIMDADDKIALGKDVGDDKPVYVTADDLDEEDEELAAFEALEVEERLGRLVDYLRKEYRYCFWCKSAYPDEEMEGCPGPTEEDHD